MEKALELFYAAWRRILGGDFFDQHTNTTFKYMLQSLWKTKYQTDIKQELIKHLPNIQKRILDLENPPPYLYELISLNDNDINKIIQDVSILELVKSAASESSTYNVLNLIETFSEKNIPIEGFVSTIIKHLKQNFNKDMLVAIAYMICSNHSEFRKKFLEKFMIFNDLSILKEFVSMSGRAAVLELTQIAKPGILAKLSK
jgi:hypothetical protein